MIVHEQVQIRGDHYMLAGITVIRIYLGNYILEHTRISEYQGYWRLFKFGSLDGVENFILDLSSLPMEEDDEAFWFQTSTVLDIPVDMYLVRGVQKCVQEDIKKFASDSEYEFKIDVMKYE